MPRPKGSRNKKNAAETNNAAVTNFDELIAAAEAEIASRTEELKGKKAELKALIKAKDKADKAAAKKKVEEDRRAILAAVEVSGKSVEEILEFLK